MLKLFEKIFNYATWVVWHPPVMGGDPATVLDDRVKELTDRIKSVREDAQAKWTAFDELRTELAKEEVDVSDPESEVFKKADEAHREYSLKADELATLEGQRERLWAMTSNGPKKADDPTHEIKEEVKDLAHSLNMGDRILASDGYKKLKESGLLEQKSAQIGSVQLGEGATRAEFKALITGASDTSAGAFVFNDVQGYVNQPVRPLLLANLITIGDTDSDTVEYVREGARTDAAAETAEATATGGSSGTKPESEYVFEKVVEAVSTIAHWIPATRRALADAGQLRTLLDSNLRNGLNQRLESQIVSGDGVGENLLGILNTPGIGTQAMGGDTRPDAIHKAITILRLAFHEPTGVALHPNDWQDIRLQKDSNGNYLYGPPSMAGTQQIWGLPIVTGPQFPAGTGVVADWAQAILWIREGIQVLASDSHADFFIRNLIALLAEMRAAFGVQRPAAFCQVTGI